MSSAVHADSLADEALALSIPVESSSSASLQQPQGRDGPHSLLVTSADNTAGWLTGKFRRLLGRPRVHRSCWWLPPHFARQQHGEVDDIFHDLLAQIQKLQKFEMRAATPDSSEMRAFAEPRARRHHRNGSDRTPECFIGTVSTWHSPAADLQCICRKESIDSCDWICSAQGYHLA